MQISLSNPQIKCSSWDFHPPLSHTKNIHYSPLPLSPLSPNGPSSSFTLPMSSTTTTTTTSPSAAAAAATSSYLTNLGLGYAIAIAFAFLVLLSTILLASYLCCRRRPYPLPHSPNPTGAASAGNPADGIVLPRIIFVAEDEDEDQNAVVGLDQAVIDSYPKFPFSKSNTHIDSVCSICLCEYKDAEMLRMMPDCRHCFHLCCVDAWLKLNASCPVCRNSPLPTPLSTPLSEVVPLSQYPGDRRRR